MVFDEIDGVVSIFNAFCCYFYLILCFLLWLLLGSVLKGAVAGRLSRAGSDYAPTPTPTTPLVLALRALVGGAEWQIENKNVHFREVQRGRRRRRLSLFLLRMKKNGRVAKLRK